MAEFKNPLNGIVQNGAFKKNVILLGSLFGIIASGILILNYVQNRKYYDKQRELAKLQEELIRLQLNNLRNGNTNQIR
jgi:hypothetical protein